VSAVPDRLVAMQIGAVSFVDEGVDQTLDILAGRGAVNALFLATPTWTRGTGGRQIPGHPLPDHGVGEYDLGWVGGNYAIPHPEYYGNTVLGAVGKAPENPDFDLLGEVIPKARERGMKSFAWMEESGGARQLRTYPNFAKVLEVDVWGRPGRRPCFNNPDYRNWHLGFVEDYVQSYQLDGLAWCSERPGPLNMLMQGTVDVAEVGCFCTHCRRIARERGIDVDRALRGYRELVDWNQRVGAGERPVDGAFVTFWRILLNFPEVLAWQTLWTESQRQLYRDIYGVAKAISPEVQVGWHVYHNISFSPFYRADQDYAEMAKFSDFIKVVIYNNCAGPRFFTWVKSICGALFADAEPEDVYPLMMKLLQLDEGDYEKLPQTGFTADYVRRETERAVAGVGGQSKIYPGIDIDIPVGVAKQRGLESPRDLGTKINWDDNEGELTRCTRESVRDATLAAFEGGAEGVVLSRKYSEMLLDNLSGAGDAVRSLA
jgi:hypothetical protein